MKLPQKVTVGGLTVEPTAIVTLALEDGKTITGMAAELESLLRIRNYKGAPEGSPEWKTEILRLVREHKQLEKLLRSQATK